VKGNINKTFDYQKVDKIKEILEILPTLTSLVEFNGYVEKQYKTKQFRLLFNNERKLKVKNHKKILGETLEEYGYELEGKRMRKQGERGKYVMDYKATKLAIISRYEKRVEKKQMLDQMGDDEESIIPQCLI
jgi:hypothetical protein